MDIMDIQAVESKLNDVTVTPIPRSQVQNFYNYQQQREQREQQPQIQISAIHHAPRDRSSINSAAAAGNGRADIYAIKRERDYHHHHHQHQQQQQQQQTQSASSSISAAAAAAALYTQQLQAQLAMLQQQSNTTASPAVTALTTHRASVNNNSINAANIGSAAGIGTQSQLKYPQSTSPLIITTQTSSNIITPLTATANLPAMGNATVNSNGLSKYAQLLAIIEEMGRDIRPTYTGSRTSTERLKRGIVHARILVRECLMETERSARQ